MLLHLQENQLVPLDRKKKKINVSKKLLKWSPSLKALYARAVSLTARQTKEHQLNKNELINECSPLSPDAHI